MSINASKRVQWKGKNVGDYAFVSFNYSANNDVRVIPRAKGVKIRSTEELGGGYLTITVSAIVAKNSRFELEDFFYTLDANLSLTVPGDLVISDENGTRLIADCHLDSFSQDSNDLKVNTFQLSFLKSL